MGAYCAIDRFGHVLNVGRDPDDAIGQMRQHELPRVWRIYPCDQDVLACFAACDDVLIRIENGLAVI